MGKINPKVIDLVVNNDLCIGCGLCAYKCPEKAIEMQWSKSGFLIPALTGKCDVAGDCLSVCPFNPMPDESVRTETELADIFHQTSNFHPGIGRYFGLYAGYSEEFRLTSSSGGIATFMLSELLDRGVVDHVFSVKESPVPGVHYEYGVSSNRTELLASAKTKYYPVTMSVVLSKISEFEGKVAIVGVACFIKAIRLAQQADAALKKKIPFLVGIICGGIKSRFFSEYLAEKSGVSSMLYAKPEFRIKDFKSMAGDYSFGCVNTKEGIQRTVRMRSVGDMWGSGLFKANACDFCDDVTTELADISLGDAWIPPFNADGRGTNVVVTRSELAERMLRIGMAAGKVKLESLSLDRFLSSQKGSFTHRQQALAFRIHHYKRNAVIPPKRFVSGKISVDVKMIQLQRRKVRQKSLDTWEKTGSSVLFDRLMKNDLYLLRKLTYINHFKKKLQSKLNVEKK